MGIIWVAIFQVGVFLGGNFLGGSFPRQELCRGDVPWVGIFFGGSFPGGNFPVGIIRVPNFLGGSFHVTDKSPS